MLNRRFEIRLLVLEIYLACGELSRFELVFCYLKFSARPFGEE
jgi:hypothetical protein